LRRPDRTVAAALGDPDKSSIAEQAFKHRDTGK
jgi:hypothetical protein